MEHLLNNQELLTYLNDSEDLEKLENEEIKEIIVNGGSRLKKWIRLRKTGEETTYESYEYGNGIFFKWY